MPASSNRNVALLILGFAAGQGSLFLAQTWLVAKGEVAFIGLYGLCFSYLVLTQYIVDLGGLVILARDQVNETEPRQRNANFWGLTWARLLLALLLAAAALIWAGPIFGPFYAAYIITACPGLVIFALNGGGVLDGLRRSGLNGLAAATPYVLTAAALLLPFGDDIGRARLLGAAFSLGLILQVAAQYAFLAAAGWRPGMPVFSPAAIAAMAWRGLLYLATWLPSQVLFRVQITMATLFFGPEGGGLVIYAKQILNAGMQLLVFIRRAEFPALVEFMRTPQALSAAVLSQKKSHLAAVAGFALTLVLGFAPMVLNLDTFAQAGWMLVLFAPVILVSNFYSNFNQIAFASDRLSQSSTGALLLLPIAFAIFFLAARSGSLTLFALSETAVAAVGCLLVGGLLALHGGRRPG